MRLWGNTTEPTCQGEPSLEFGLAAFLDLGELDQIDEHQNRSSSRAVMVYAGVRGADYRDRAEDIARQLRPRARIIGDWHSHTSDREPRASRVRT